MTYTLNWTSNSKTPVSVDPLSIETDSTSLVLTGKGYPNYGEFLQENFLKILENFSAPTPPLNPITTFFIFHHKHIISHFILFYYFNLNRIYDIVIK